jgi:hypothetical protein
MESIALFTDLQAINDRPAVFSRMTVAGLRIAELLGDVAGRRFDPDSPRFAVVARL